MGSFSIWHWIIVLIVIVVVFGGRGRISALMADIGKGLKSLKSELNKDDNEKPLPNSQNKKKHK